MNNYIINDYDSQVKNIFKKLTIKKSANKIVLDYLYQSNQIDKKNRILHCAESIGIRNVEGIARIVRADFCRERICNVCAWRRQAKFLCTTQPVLDYLYAKNYKFIFISLTIKNPNYENLKKEMDNIFEGLKRFNNNRHIKKSIKGYIRSVEMTYNQKTNEYHPHVHMLCAVEQDYFTNSDKYISQSMLCELWQLSARLNYTPDCDIRKVDDTDKASLETLKYALKPSEYIEAIKAFDKIFKGRRLISFTGIIAKIRKDLKLNDDENLLDISKDEKVISFDLFKFDINGGFYKFQEKYIIKEQYYE